MKQEEWYAYENEHSILNKPEQPFEHSIPSNDFDYTQQFIPSNFNYLALPLKPSESYAPQKETSSEEIKLLGPLTSYYVPSIHYPIHTNAPFSGIDHFLKNKQEFLTKSIQDITSLIEERMTIKYDNIKKIDYESTKTRSRLFDIEAWRSGVNPMMDKTRSNIERELQGFEREKRFEETACWRDLVRLRSELRESMREWHQQKNREQLLGGYGD